MHFQSENINSADITPLVCLSKESGRHLHYGFSQKRKDYPEEPEKKWKFLQISIH